MIAGRRDLCGIATTVESTDRVQIVAECREPFVPPGNRSALGIPYEFVVALDEPLGGRRVIDGLGSPGERCPVPRCGLP